jgi:nucleotidyltransferase-like protein
MNEVPTIPYPELPWVLDELVAGVRTELADNLVGVYLVGSLATGDFDRASDVDFLVVTRYELDDTVIPALQARLDFLRYALEEGERRYVTRSSGQTTRCHRHDLFALRSDFQHHPHMVRHGFSNHSSGRDLV